MAGAQKFLHRVNQYGVTNDLENNKFLDNLKKDDRKNFVARENDERVYVEKFCDEVSFDKYNCDFGDRNGNRNDDILNF
ncbi:MAG: hypothetical protein LBJ09_03715 [Clostridiales bacterium]|jgi:hypothetical protein|nr:hypothetical protein [Clostridiales bacterium]